MKKFSRTRAENVKSYLVLAKKRNRERERGRQLRWFPRFLFRDKLSGKICQKAQLIACLQQIARSMSNR